MVVPKQPPDSVATVSTVYCRDSGDGIRRLFGYYQWISCSDEQKNEYLEDLHAFGTCIGSGPPKAPQRLPRLVIMILCDADAVFSATGSKREVSPERSKMKNEQVRRAYSNELN